MSGLSHGDLAKLQKGPQSRMTSARLRQNLKELLNSVGGGDLSQWISGKKEMAETGFPGQHTTTTTVTSNTTVQTNIRFDPSYIRTLPGILKVVQVVFSLIGFICIQFSYFNNASKGLFFSWISMIAFWFTGILLGFYLFHIVEKFYKIPWLKIELVFTALWTFFYLLASILAVTVHDNPHAAASFFGFSCALSYCVDAYLKWRAARGGGLAQGTRVVSKQTTTREGY